MHGKRSGRPNSKNSQTLKRKIALAPNGNPLACAAPAHYSG